MEFTHLTLLSKFFGQSQALTRQTWQFFSKLGKLVQSFHPVSKYYKEKKIVQVPELISKYKDAVKIQLKTLNKRKNGGNPPFLNLLMEIFLA